MIEAAVHADLTMIADKIIAPINRVITDKVYLALIGSTVVEVASLLIVISRYLFQK